MLVEDKSFDNVCEKLVEHMKNRLGTKPLPSRCLLSAVIKNMKCRVLRSVWMPAAIFLDHMENATVDVHDPQVKVYIEIRGQSLCICYQREGTGRNAGRNSRPLYASSFRWHRQPGSRIHDGQAGVRIEAVYFHAPPYTSERAKQKVVDLAQIISEYTGPIQLHIINFTDIQLAIYEKVPA